MASWCGALALALGAAAAGCPHDHVSIGGQAAGEPCFDCMGPYGRAAGLETHGSRPVYASRWAHGPARWLYYSERKRGWVVAARIGATQPCLVVGSDAEAASGLRRTAASRHTWYANVEDADQLVVGGGGRVAAPRVELTCTRATQSPTPVPTPVPTPRRTPVPTPRSTYAPTKWPTPAPTPFNTTGLCARLLLSTERSGVGGWFDLWRGAAARRFASARGGRPAYKCEGGTSTARWLAYDPHTRAWLLSSAPGEGRALLALRRTAQETPFGGAGGWEWAGSARAREHVARVRVTCPAPTPAPTPVPTPAPTPVPTPVPTPPPTTFAHFLAHLECSTVRVSGLPRPWQDWAGSYTMALPFLSHGERPAFTNRGRMGLQHLFFSGKEGGWVLAATMEEGAAAPVLRARSFAKVPQNVGATWERLIRSARPGARYARAPTVHVRCDRGSTRTPTPAPQPRASLCKRVRLRVTRGALGGTRDRLPAEGTYALLQAMEVARRPVFSRGEGASRQLLYFREASLSWTVGHAVGAAPFELVLPSAEAVPYGAAPVHWLRWHHGRFVPFPGMSAICVQAEAPAAELALPDSLGPDGLIPEGVTEAPQRPSSSSLPFVPEGLAASPAPPVMPARRGSCNAVLLAAEHETPCRGRFEDQPSLGSGGRRVYAYRPSKHHHQHAKRCGDLARTFMFFRPSMHAWVVATLVGDSFTGDIVPHLVARDQAREPTDVHMEAWELAGGAPARALVFCGSSFEDLRWQDVKRFTTSLKASRASILGDSDAGDPPRHATTVLLAALSGVVLVLGLVYLARKSLRRRKRAPQPRYTELQGAPDDETAEGSQGGSPAPGARRRLQAASDVVSRHKVVLGGIAVRGEETFGTGAAEEPPCSLPGGTLGTDVSKPTLPADDGFDDAPI